MPIRFSCQDSAMRQTVSMGMRISPEERVLLDALSAHMGLKGGKVALIRRALDCWLDSPEGKKASKAITTQLRK